MCGEDEVDAQTSPIYRHQNGSDRTDRIDEDRACGLTILSFNTYQLKYQVMLSQAIFSLVHSK